MKTKVILAFLLIVLFACIGKTLAQQVKISPELRRKIMEEGTASVIVRINVPTQLEPTLSPEAKLNQRNRILLAQQQLQAELAGIPRTIIRKEQPKTEALLFVQIGPNALATLDRSNLVLQVIDNLTLDPLMEIR